MTKYIETNESLPAPAANTIAAILQGTLDLFSQIGPLSELTRQELIDLMTSEDIALFVDDDSGLAARLNEFCRVFGKAVAIAFDVEDTLAQEDEA